MSHSVFTIVTPITPGRVDHLRDVLADIERSHEDNRYLRFPQFDELHFASFVIFVDAGPALLVFENSVDGPADRYIRRLLEAGSGLDWVYANCVGYDPDAPLELKHRYLAGHIRKPDLYHVGTPYRAATSIREDRDLRVELDRRLDALMDGSLPAQLGEAAPGSQEFSRWEQVKLYGLPALLGLALGLVVHAIWVHHWWLLPLTFWRVGRWPTQALLLSLAVALWLMLLVGGLYGITRWLNAPVETRAWGLAGLVVGYVVPMLWAAHFRSSLSLLLLAASTPFLRALSDARRHSDRQLELVRRNADGRSPAALWTELQALLWQRGQRPGFRWLTRYVNFVTRAWNWRGWAIAYLSLYVPIRIFSPGHPRRVALAVTVLFLLKASWLSVLVGWPVRLFWSRPIVAFILIATLGGFLEIRWLQAVEWAPAPIALVVLGSLFVLWMVPLPSPGFPLQRLTSPQMDAITTDEDRQAQNHMAALVLVRDSPLRFRAILLRAFLWTLNWVFFRAWLADVERGKLFGISTVHFAQWVLLDDRRYIFLSNYDHSWPTYLDDFGTQLTTGIQKIWGQGEGNPGTTDLVRFKEFARSVMVRHSVWYSAYPDLTVRQIWNNERIRRELVRDADDITGVGLFPRFAAAPRILNAFSK